jgi:hypothetical protein
MFGDIPTPRGPLDAIAAAAIPEHEASGPEHLISGDIRSDETVRFRGCVDGFDAEFGISGWAIDLEAPEIPVALQFVVDGTVVRECSTTRARADIAALFPQHDVAPEFHISAATILALGNLLRLRPELDFSFRIAGTSFVLPRVPAFPDLGGVVSRCYEATRQIQRHFDLYSHLMQLRALAAPIAHLPLRKQEGYRKGFIEALCMDDQGSGLLWFVGWTSEPNIFDEASVVVDMRKYPAAFSVVRYTRDDLPAGASGMIGVILSDWRPLPGSVLTLYFGADGKSHLLGVPDLPVVDKSVIVNQLQSAQNHAVGRLFDLLALLQGSPSWLPNTAAHEDVKAAVDRLLILPGFGCFVIGWVLSYVHEAQGVILKVGDIILPMNASSLRFFDRPDLASAFPDAAYLCPRAGFCCFFPGDPDIRLLEQPLVKILLDDGGVVVFRVELGKIRRLGYSESFDSLFALYPALDREAFFPSLKQSIRALYQSRMSQLTPFRIAKAPRALVVALPDDPHDCRLAFEDLFHNVGRFLPLDCGIAIIGSVTQRHGQVVELYEGLAGDLDRPSSLVFCENTVSAIYILSELLLLMGADQFVFLETNHFLTEGGWEMVREMLKSPPRDPVFLGVVDPDTLNEPVNASSCLAWNRRALSAWSEEMPLLIETPFDHDDFPRQKPSPDVRGKGAYLSKSKPVSRIAALLNRSSRQDNQLADRP